MTFRGLSAVVRNYRIKGMIVAVGSRILGKIRDYNEEIALGFFCVGLLLYALGIGNVKTNLQTQSLFHIGGLIFIICNYRSFSKQTWQVLKIPVLCFGVVFVLSLFTIFDDVYVRKVSAVLKDINQNIIGLLVLFVIMCLYALHAKRKNVNILFCFFGLLCVIEIATMLYLGYKNGLVSNGAKNAPFFSRYFYL